MKLNVFIAICVLMPWFSIGSMDMKGLEEQITEIRKMEDQEHDLWKQMEDLEKAKLEFDAERTKLDEKKQTLNAEKDNKKGDLNLQKQKLQEEKQTKIMEARPDQKASIKCEYAGRIAQLDDKKAQIAEEIANQKSQIDGEKGKIFAAKCKLQVKKSNIKNEQYA